MKIPQRVLVIATRRLGDVLLTTPLLRSLRQAWPQAKIDVLVFAHTAGVLLHNPDIHRVMTVPARPGFWQHLSFVSRIFRRYDLAISTLTGDRPTLYAWLAGKMCIGMLEDSRKQRWKQHMLSHWAAFDNLGTHTVLMNLRLADLLGIRRSHEIVVSWNTADEDRVASLLPFDLGSGIFAVLHVYPQFAYKMWRQENWTELALWLKETGIRVVLTGSDAPDEREYIDKVFHTLPDGTVNMAGRLNIPESAFLVSRARVYVGPDTMLTHVAAAVGTPTIALFGPSNPVKWGPWPKGYTQDHNPYQMKGSQRVNNVVLLQGSGECVPCMLEGCERRVASLSDCLQNLPVASVIAAIQQLTC
ncbi:MAG: glycosyltransferase family 9 protein [Gallionellaceae bacterium]